MALINRIAVSNVLNIHGESPRANWSPRFRYELLSFNGQSTAVNLTNGGGKTTFAEAILAVLSRDTTLITRTKQKLSPSNTRVFSHVQVELIRPRASASQSDLLTSEGHEVDGDLWVFGMYGYRDRDEDLSYYYYPGNLSLCPIGVADGHKRRLVLNSEFMENLKSIRGSVRGSRRHEWHEVLAAKANLPQSTLQQMVNFQKRPGDDKSALLLDIKTKPGESYAEAFFYKVLAPAVMEGIMDREGEEDEITLEDTVERAVYSTVKAKRDTEAYREQADELEQGLNELNKVLRKAEEAGNQRANYERHLDTIRQDSSTLMALVRNAQLIGVPRSAMPEGQLSKIAPFVVVEVGTTEVRILDRGLSVLTGREPAHINELADRQKIQRRKVTQVLEIPCDLEIRRGGHKGSMYALPDAIRLLEVATSGQKNAVQSEIIEALESWFDQYSDTNPFRARLIQDEQELQQLKSDESEIDQLLGELQDRKTRLITQQQRMEANEGQFRVLEESGLFSVEELQAPLLTAESVQQELIAAQSSLQSFNGKKAALEEYRPAWIEFQALALEATDPGVVLDSRRTELTERNEQLSEVKADIAQNREQANTSSNELSEIREALEGCKKEADRIGEYRGAHQDFQDQFSCDDPLLKEQQLLDERDAVIVKLRDLKEEGVRCQQGSDAVQGFQETIDNELSPDIWIKNALARRQAVTVDISDNSRDLKDLKERRRALDDENIAANAATRRANDRISNRNIPFQPLHRYVESLSLPSLRQRQVLSLFSSLLFAPVIKEPSDAITAANELSANDEQVPVFLASSLEKFCRNASIEMACRGTLAVAAIAGISTRAVECLIDPALVIREKEILEENIASVEAIVKCLEQELLELADSGSKMQLAKRAQQAIVENEPVRLKELQLEIGNISTDLELLNALCSTQTKNMIRRAAEYVRLGGKAQDDTYQQNLLTLANRREELQEQLSTLDMDFESLRKLVDFEAMKIGQILPPNVEILLEKAATFYQKDGPSFFTELDEVKTRLATSLAQANERHSYSSHFPAAQAYLDSLSEESEQDDLAKRIADVSRQVVEKSGERKRVRSAYQCLYDKLPDLRRVLLAVDQSAMAAIAKYRQIAQLEADLQAEDGIVSHPLLDIAQNIQSAIDHEDLDKVTQEARSFSEEISDLHIERKASELKSAKKHAIEAEKSFVEYAKSTADTATAFKPVERNILLQAHCLDAADAIKNMYHSLLETFSRIKSRLEDCASAELEARRNVSSRLAHLIAMAKYDFDIMRNVMRENRGAHHAHFNVDARILEIDDGKRLIESIIEEVDFLDKQRRDRQRVNAEEAGEDAFHDQIRDMLRAKLYKSIFTNPKIRYTNETIRAAQKNNEFTDKLSEGQKAAMSLMWMIRLAEFAIERGAKRMSGRSAQRKVRERSENVIIIDGLFSNLSDRYLIDSAMAGIESTRGRFQLIGLIHNPHYQNDFTKFPIFIIGKNRGRVGGKAGWVSFQGQPVPSEDAGTVGFAQLRRVPVLAET